MLKISNVTKDFGICHGEMTFTRCFVFYSLKFNVCDGSLNEEKKKNSKIIAIAMDDDPLLITPS